MLLCVEGRERERARALAFVSQRGVFWMRNAKTTATISHSLQYYSLCASELICGEVGLGNIIGRRRRRWEEPPKKANSGDAAHK